ncbi:hypothetical protein KC19_1G091700 [Ceratodon purpureus]|uniref:Uncharacterized protein n=1 Tax=Ceratodon purpureus TaxID=3225 RepID=A0A8T0J6B2_CERPU|nr:hypothetical protein KC19_1G091700 [Ceratodon purpureus]
MLLFVQINQIIRCRLHSAEALRNQICSVYTDQQARRNKKTLYMTMFWSLSISTITNFLFLFFYFSKCILCVA